MTGGMDNPVDVAFSSAGERFFTTTFLQHPAGGQRDGVDSRDLWRRLRQIARRHRRPPADRRIDAGAQPLGAGRALRIDMP